MKISFALMLLCFSCWPAFCDEATVSSMDINCLRNEEAAQIPAQYASWFSMVCGDFGQLIMVNAKEKGHQMVSKGGLMSLNISAKVDIHKYGEMTNELSAESIVFTSIDGVTPEGEIAKQINELFDRVFPTYQARGDREVHVLKFEGYDEGLYSSLFLLTVDGAPQRAILQENGGEKTTAWEMIDGVEWSNRAGMNTIVLDDVIDDESPKSK